MARGNASFRWRWPIRTRVFSATTSINSLERAWAKAVRFGISNRVTFERIAAEDLPYVDRFDLVTAFNCIHDIGHQRAALAAIRRIVKPSGSFLWSEAQAGDRLEEKSHSAGTNDVRR